MVVQDHTAETVICPPEFEIRTLLSQSYPALYAAQEPAISGVFVRTHSFPKTGLKSRARLFYIKSVYFAIKQQKYFAKHLH